MTAAMRRARGCDFSSRSSSRVVECFIDEHDRNVADDRVDPAALDALQTLLDHGFLPNVFLGFAHRPDEARAFLDYHDALLLREGGLSKAEREMIVVATSAANSCEYCVVAHGAILRNSAVAKAFFHLYGCVMMTPPVASAPALQCVRMRAPAGTTSAPKRPIARHDATSSS